MIVVANVNDRVEVERFLRDANAEELTAERKHLQDLMAGVAAAGSELIEWKLAARITYELRFRVPQFA